MKNRFENTAMGGPCILASGRKAPACTDNFQLARFKFNGKEWQSCEQCFQVRAPDKCAPRSPPGHRFTGVQEP